MGEAVNFGTADWVPMGRVGLGLYKGLYELNPVDLELESAWFQLLNP